MPMRLKSPNGAVIADPVRRVVATPRKSRRTFQGSGNVIPLKLGTALRFRHISQPIGLQPSAPFRLPTGRHGSDPWR